MGDVKLGELRMLLKDIKFLVVKYIAFYLSFYYVLRPQYTAFCLVLWIYVLWRTAAIMNIASLEEKINFNECTVQGNLYLGYCRQT